MGAALNPVALILMLVVGRPVFVILLMTALKDVK